MHSCQIAVVHAPHATSTDAYGKFTIWDDGRHERRGVDICVRRRGRIALPYGTENKAHKEISAGGLH